MITELETELDFQIVISSVIGVIGAVAFPYQIIFKFLIPFRRKAKIDYERLSAFTILSVAMMVWGVYFFNKWYNLKNNRCITTGTTISTYLPSDGGRTVTYEYIVNEIRYEATSSTYPIDYKDLIVPGGKYRVIYECENPSNSKIDFFKE